MAIRVTLGSGVCLRRAFASVLGLDCGTKTMRQLSCRLAIVVVALVYYAVGSWRRWWVARIGREG